MDEATTRRRARVRLGATALGVTVVGIAGYVGSFVFVGSDRGAASGVLVLAAGTGFASFFSPCSFPLLLTFLTKRSVNGPRAALVSALRVATGASVLLATVAMAMALGGTVLGAVVQFDSILGRLFRLGVGLALVLFGLRQASLWRLHMRWIHRIADSSARWFDSQPLASPGRRDVAYGFGYLLAGFG